MPRKKRPKGSQPELLPPSIKDMRLFVALWEAVAKFKNIQAAEKELLRNFPGGVSFYYRKIKELENWLWQGEEDRPQLIARKPGTQSAVNHDYESVYKKFKAVIDDYDNAVRQIPSGREQVTVVCTNAISIFFLPALLKPFLAGHNNTDLRIIEGEWWDIDEAVLRSRADFGIGSDPEHRKPGLEYVHLYNLRRLIAFHPSHRFKKTRKDEAVPVKELADETLLLLPERVQPNFPFKDLPAPTPGKGRRITLQTYAETNVWIGHNLGVGIVHEGFDLPGDTSATIATREPAPALGFTPVFLYCRPGKEESLPNESARDLFRAVKETAR